MVKSEIHRDAEILVRNPSPILFGEKFRDSKKVKTNHEKTRLRDLSKTFPRFRDPAKIFRDPRFSRYHSPPLSRLHLFSPSPFCILSNKPINPRESNSVSNAQWPETASNSPSKRYFSPPASFNPFSCTFRRTMYLSEDEAVKSARDSV